MNLYDKRIILRQAILDWSIERQRQVLQRNRMRTMSKVARPRVPSQVAITAYKAVVIPIAQKALEMLATSNMYYKP